MQEDVFIDHHIAQLWGVDEEFLKNERTLTKKALEIAASLGLTVINTFVHQFEPHGLSLILVISQSHLAIHTWPELGYLHVDILSCSPDTNLKNLEEILNKEFKPKKTFYKKIDY